MSQPRLPIPELATPTPTPTTGTCRECHQTVRTFLYDPKAQAPWWYAIAHRMDPKACAGEVLDCPGGGYPVLEQERPPRSRTGS